MDIQVRATTVDSHLGGKVHHFKTLAGAQRFADRYMGDQYEISSTTGYAISGDGICKITANINLRTLFPNFDWSYLDERRPSLSQARDARPCCSSYHYDGDCYHCGVQGYGYGFCNCSDADIQDKADDDATYMAYQLRCFCGACWEGLADMDLDPDEVARIMAKPAPCALAEYRASQDRTLADQEVARRQGEPIW